MINRDKLVALPLTNNEMKIALGSLRQVLPELIAMQAIVAEIIDARYKELTLRGFTKEQAIELCKSISSTSF